MPREKYYSFLKFFFQRNIEMISHQNPPIHLFAFIKTKLPVWDLYVLFDFLPSAFVLPALPPTANSWTNMGTNITLFVRHSMNNWWTGKIWNLLPVRPGKNNPFGRMVTQPDQPAAASGPRVIMLTRGAFPRLEFLGRNQNLEIKFPRPRLAFCGWFWIWN